MRRSYIRSSGNSMANSQGRAVHFWISQWLSIGLDGLLTVNEGALELFRSKYKLPLFSAEFTAHLATNLTGALS